MNHRRQWRALISAVGLVIVSACSDGFDTGCDCIPVYQAIATGSNVAAHKNPADTAVRATYTIAGWDTASWKYTQTAITPAPHGAITAIRLLQGTVVKGTLCTGAGCGAAVSFTKINGVTDVNLTTAMRNLDVRVVVLTDSDPAGAASGAIYPLPP